MAKQNVMLLSIVLGVTFASATPLLDCAKLVNYTGSEISLQNLTAALLPLHHKERRSVQHPLGGFGNSQTTDILKFATLMPAETLHLLRMVTVPLLNTTLTVPANILEDISNGSLPTIPGANWSAGKLSNMTHMGLGQLQHGFSLSSHGMFNTTNSSGAVVVVQEKIFSPMSTFLKSTINTTGQAIPSALKPTYFMKHLDNFRRYLATGASADTSITSTDVQSTASVSSTGCESASGSTVVDVQSGVSSDASGTSATDAGVVTEPSSPPAPPQVGAAPPPAEGSTTTERTPVTTTLGPL